MRREPSWPSTGSGRGEGVIGLLHFELVNFYWFLCAHSLHIIYWIFFFHIYWIYTAQTPPKRYFSIQQFTGWKHSKICLHLNVFDSYIKRIRIWAYERMCERTYIYIYVCIKHVMEKTKQIFLKYTYNNYKSSNDVLTKKRS